MLILSGQFWRMAVLWPLALIYSYILLSLRSRHSTGVRRTAPRRLLDSAQLPICVITGANSGLGAAAAMELSREGFYVVLVGRSKELLLEIKESIKQKNGVGEVEVFQVDMLSASSILKFKNALQEWFTDSNLHPSIQLLINNAGILGTSHGPSIDGYDRMMKTNYFGAFLLTNVLLPLLKNSPVPSRIVNVSSFTHRSVFTLPSITDQSLKCFKTAGSYPFAKIYECSKLYMLLFTYELHHKLYSMDHSCRISAMAADPGVVATNIMRELPQHITQFAFFALKLLHLLQSPECGVSSIIDAALAPPEKSGEYFFGGNGMTISSSALSYNAKLSKALWDSSMTLLLESSAS